MGRTFGRALYDSVRFGRAALAVMILVGLPLALPFVLEQVLNGLTLRGILGGPLPVADLVWVTANPEAIWLLLFLWALYVTPWAVGIWGLRAGFTPAIGWEPYGHYSVVVFCGAAVLILGRVLSSILLGFAAIPLVLVVQGLFQLLALYSVLRLAPNAPAIRDGGFLDLPSAWRASAGDRASLFGLAALWSVLGLVLQTCAQLLALLLHSALASVDVGGSWGLLLITTGAPGLITGVVQAYVGLVGIALFWCVAERQP